MLSSRCRKPAWRKPLLITRHQSPLATSGPRSPASWITVPPPLNEPVPPPASSIRKTITLIAIRPIVAGILPAVGVKAA